MCEIMKEELIYICDMLFDLSELLVLGAKRDQENGKAERAILLLDASAHMARAVIALAKAAHLDEKEQRQMSLKFS
jgi:hypothetical protein